VKNDEMGFVAKYQLSESSTSEHKCTQSSVPMHVVSIHKPRQLSIAETNFQTKKKPVSEVHVSHHK